MSKTIINKDQLDSSVFSIDNLIGGNNINIIQVPEPVIDQYTVGLFHFDQAVKDEITGTVTSIGSIEGLGKFNNCVKLMWRNGVPCTTISGSSNYTVDFWIKQPSSFSYIGFDTGAWSAYVLQFDSATTFRTSGVWGTISGYFNLPTGVSYTADEWHHIAYVHDTSNLKVYIFLDGIKIYDEQMATADNRDVIGLGYVENNTYIDELRFSNTVRWTSDFTPFSLPYAAGQHEPQYRIDNIQNISGKQDKTLSTAITVDGTSQTTVEGALSAINDLAENNKNPEGLYTSSNLIAGTNISITGSSPVANYAIVGSPTITDYVMSNISDSNYVNTRYIYSPTTTWEAKLKFTMPSSNYDWRKITNSETDFRGGHSLGITSGNKIQLEATLNGSSWGINLNGSTTLQFNTTYWAKYGWDGTAYYVDISTDGETYTREASTNNSSQIVATQPLIIGRAAASGHYFTGSIDLASIEFYENNVLVYSGVKDTIKQINTDFTNVSGYSSSGTKVLETVDGTLTWVTPQGGGSVTPTLRNYSNTTGTTLATGLILSGFNAIMVFKNGMLLRESVLDSDSDLESDEEVNDYIISGNNLVFTLALESTDTITIFAM